MEQYDIEVKASTSSFAGLISDNIKKINLFKYIKKVISLTPVDWENGKPLYNTLYYPLANNPNNYLTSVTNISNSDLTLTGNRIVTLDNNNLSFNGAGNIGIGTTSPTSKLHIASGSSFLKVISGFSGGNGTWIDLDTTGPSGIGSGGAGSNAWIGYANLGGAWFSNSLVGDVCYRNTLGKLLFGNTSGASAAMAITNNRIGINTITPTSNIHIVGSESRSVLSITGNITLGITHNIVIIPNGSLFTVTLAAANAASGRMYRIVNKASSIKTIGNYVNKSGLTTDTIAANTTLIVVSDGTNWQQI